MVAGGMFAVMATGTMHMWVSSNQVSHDLLIRQKAVFVLHGEMERLTSMARRSEFFHSGLHYGSFFPNLAYKTFALPIFSWERYMYENTVDPFTGGGNNDFVTEDVNKFDHENDHYVLFDENGFTTDRNYVWIDRDRNIAGMISFWVQGVSVDDCEFSDCECVDFEGTSNGDLCAMTELLLDYPYSLNDSDEMEQSGPLKTLTLRTIIGRQDVVF